MVSGRRREEGFSPSSSQPSLVSGTLDPVGVHGQLVCGGFVRRFAVENNQETEVCGTRPSGRKKRKWKWPASRTPPVEGRTSREEAQTMRNEPGQDIEPENPGVVCVVHAPSLARMCRDEDPALDKIWACFRPSALAKSSRHSARMRGRGRHPSSTPNQAKRCKILSFLLFTPLEALSATSVIQDINPPTRRISNIISNVKIHTRAPSRPGCHFRRLWSSAGLPTTYPSKKGKVAS